MERKRKSSDPQNFKEMPHSDDAEMVVLAGILNNNRLLDTVNEVVVAEDFYCLRNQHIFRIMNGLYSAGSVVDMITVKSKAAEQDVSVDAAYLAKIGDYLSYTGIESHCKIIKEKSLLRKVITASQNTIQQAYDGPGDMDDFIQSSMSPGPSYAC